MTRPLRTRDISLTRFINPPCRGRDAPPGASRARARLLRLAEEILLDEVPAIPIMYYSSGSLVSSKLKGWEDNLMNAHATRWMSIEQ